MIHQHLHRDRSPLTGPTIRRSSALILAATLTLAGCTTHPRIGAGREYPSEKEHGQAANIQVARRVTEVSFTNTSARRLPPGTIWANSAYSRDFPGLAVGDSITLPLGEFKNRFGEPFRAGGFFATERPFPLVRLQIETDTDMIGLTVIGGTIE